MNNVSKFIDSQPLCSDDVTHYQSSSLICTQNPVNLR